ncbi:MULTISPECIES: IS21 family transposase [unclassified Mesorhizobium]|uniref:IS21 family transposase n=1 Tax=unclassified Mesorhizobium TaxID=325217 RepID=UPI00112D77D0|nr:MULTISPECIES: IS21 family transposase [unclassified Mesorhizobium]TPI51695.1 IS21 family transposase [Mesorhizobium sp. B3-1-1]TPJ60521.1 IS21 family transposase [Mesorhizobium sp. B2-6-7]TPJ77911.1 IS21 family transposase [Mesorhizobium sp. B2-6-3]TPJ92547.1 IS21 family transposase [Mesorhizobium sp. B2-5-10]TPK11078.1 IS21 family transposase [Mesorhizobium sp. B2-5-11]
MPRRKQARRTSVRDIQAILRLIHEHGLSVREVSERLKISKTTVSTYLLRAREAGLSCWPLPPGHDDATLERLLFGSAGRPPQDLSEPDFALIARELKRKGVTLTLLWQEYRAAHPDGYGYTWFCEHFAAFEHRTSATFRNRHAAGAVMKTDYAGQTVPVIDPATGVIYPAQIFVAVLGASNLTFAFASSSQKLPDWIEGQVRALAFFGGVTRAIACDNLKAGVVKALWFEPTLNATFAAMAEHYDTTILPTRSRKPRDKAKVEGAVLIVERWILARLRNRSFFSIAELNAAIAELLEELNNRPMRHVGQSRRELFEEIERAALKPLPAAPFEYAEWKSAKVHPDYHVEADKTFYSVPHRLIGRTVEVRLTHRVVEIFHDHQRVASHVRRSQRSGHVTVNEHMPKAHQRYANTTPASLISRAARIGPNAAILVERMMHDRPHPEQGYRSAMGILSLAPRYGPERLDAACERALLINAIAYSSVTAILKAGLDRASSAEPAKPTPQHANIRGSTYYQ